VLKLTGTYHIRAILYTPFFWGKAEYLTYHYSSITTELMHFVHFGDT